MGEPMGSHIQTTRQRPTFCVLAKLAPYLHIHLYSGIGGWEGAWGLIRTGFVQKYEIKIQGLFQDFSRTIYTFRSHFSWTVTHLTLLIRRISVPFKIVNAFPFRAHCFCLISALCIVSARYFRFCLSRFPLCKVSLPVAFDSYYLNQIE